MVIVWGSRLYGKVDAVPGVCHLATNFGHLYYIPLIPMGTVVVYGSAPEGDLVSEFSWSFKSILVAWLRVILIVGFVASLTQCLVIWDRGFRGEDIRVYLMMAAPIILLFLSYKVSFIARASAYRAMQIAKEARLPEPIRRALVQAIEEMHTKGHMNEYDSDFNT